MAADAERTRGWSTWWIPVVAGLLSLAAGVLAIVWPEITLLALALIAGINLLLMSGLLIGEALGGDDAGDKTLRIVVGIVGVIGGVVVLRRPGETVLVLLMALGLWLVLSGVVELIRAIVVASGSRLLRLLGGLVDVGLGIAVLALPELSLKTLAVLIGISFLVRGGLLLYAGLRLRGLQHEGAVTGAPPFGASPA